MMKVLIADDEPDVRAGLKTIIDWGSLGFVVCGEAENGEVCLREILRLLPELVLLDIRMPKMHGLECAEEARKRGWKGKIVVLSGYSDFKYAQSAIRCGVETYLLKPIDEDELADTVKKIGEKIREECRQAQQMNFAMEKAHAALLSDLLNGRDAPRAGGEQGKPMDLNADRYLVVIPERLNAGGPEPAAQTELGRMLRSGAAETVRLNGTDVYLLKGSDAIGRFERLAAAARPEEIFFAVGRAAAVPEDIALSYRDASAVFARRFFLPPGKAAVRESAAAGGLRAMGEVDLHGYVERFFTFLQAGNRDAACSLLDGLRDRFAGADIRPDYAVTMLTNLCIQLKNRILEACGGAGAFLDSDAQIITAVSGCKRLSAAIDWMKDRAESTVRNLLTNQSGSLAERVKIYVENNYSRNINLESLAAAFGYSSAYLGKVFKNSAGESFHSYLDRVRIGHAKELLGNETTKVYEISERVGYENIDYFYIKFRKYEGLSPLEYRRSIRTKEAGQA